MGDDGFGEEVLLAAAKRNNVSLLNEYIAEKGNKFDPNVKDSLGNTPLHYSAGANHTETTQILLSKGANPNIQNNTSAETPLHRAIWGNHINMVSLLIEHGGDVNIANKDKQKAANLAKSKEMKALIESAVLASQVADEDIAADDDDEDESRPAGGYDHDMVADDDDDE